MGGTYSVPKELKTVHHNCKRVQEAHGCLMNNNSNQCKMELIQACKQTILAVENTLRGVVRVIYQDDEAASVRRLVADECAARGLCALSDGTDNIDANASLSSSTFDKILYVVRHTARFETVNLNKQRLDDFKAKLPRSQFLIIALTPGQPSTTPPVTSPLSTGDTVVTLYYSQKAQRMSKDALNDKSFKTITQWTNRANLKRYNQ